MNLQFFLLFPFLVVSSVHAEGHSCACKAKELDFKIDCDNGPDMEGAMSYLRAEGCDNDCSSDICIKQYYILQAHHDFCPEEGLPQSVEDGFHDFDQTCKACDITRVSDGSSEPCPSVSCDDNSGNDAYFALVDGGCLNDCSSDACKANFLTLRTVHDSCPHDSLLQAAEEGLHDFEVPCVAFKCNLPGSEESQLVCHDHGHDDDHDHESTTNSGADTFGSWAAGVTAAGVAVMAL